MSYKPLNVLFLCTHNSARSILAEAILNHIARGRFKAWSAGSSPRANQQPHPLALQVLQCAGIPTEGLCSKSWDEFGQPGAPRMDLVITVCDDAAAGPCPLFISPHAAARKGPGRPAIAHWGLPDPSAGDAPDEVKLEAFRQTLHALRRRLDLLVSLPPATLEKAMLQGSVRDLDHRT